MSCPMDRLYLAAIVRLGLPLRAALLRATVEAEVGCGVESGRA